jgi:tetratricopeptide (TPR) repeat protein
VLVQMAAVIAFFVCGRYRMPALPVLFVFAGCALVGVAGAAKQRRWGPAAAALAGLVVCGVLVNSDWYGVKRAEGANRDWFYVGQSYYGAQQYQQAKEAWEQAIKQHPDDADSYSFLGNAEAQLGEYRSAAGHMHKALELAPDFANAAAQMAQVYLQQGWPLEEPARLLARAARAEYLNQLALGTLVTVYVRMGRVKEAKDALELAAKAVTLATPLGQPAPMLGPPLARGVQDAQAAGLQIPDALLPPRSPSGAGGP